MKKRGYAGRLLRVDLTEGKLRQEPLDEGTARRFVGGAGYGARLLYDELRADTEPLSAENQLVFMTGPLTATPFPTSGRYQVCTRSPLTGLWADASSSGFFGADLKRAGFDGVVVEGAAASPVYLWLADGHAELRPASHLWGLDTFAVQAELRRELGDRRVRVAAIGRAGERRALIASVINDAGRAAGRGGVGAVMGSKGLKAVAVRGRERVALAHPTRFRRLVAGLEEALSGPRTEALRRWGTAAAMDVGWVTGAVPVRNWRGGVRAEGAGALGGRWLAQGVLRQHAACLKCPIGCARWSRRGPGPEYETLASFGPLLLNDATETVLAANDLCNRYGLDTISAGSAVAFAMEAYERGLLAEADTGGLRLEWGNGEAVLGLVRQMGEVEGLGALLAQGVRRAAQALGGGSDEFAVHVKGLEVPMHDPRAYFGMAVSYATAPRGADHARGSSMTYETGGRSAGDKPDRFQDRGKGRLVRLSQDEAAAVNSLVVCQFAAQETTLEVLEEAWALATGWKGLDLCLAGERIFNLQRLFNLRWGASGADDRLPKRLLQALEGDGQRGRVPAVEAQLAEYYRERGWDAEGRPTPEKLRELGLA